MLEVKTIKASLHDLATTHATSKDKCATTGKGGQAEAKSHDRNRISQEQKPRPGRADDWQEEASTGEQAKHSDKGGLTQDPQGNIKASVDLSRRRKEGRARLGAQGSATS